MDVGEHNMKVVFEEGSNLNIVHLKGDAILYNIRAVVQKQLLMHRRNVYFKCIYRIWSGKCMLLQIEGSKLHSRACFHFP